MPDAVTLAWRQYRLERRLFWRRAFFINEPNAIKHMLLDNAANYSKTELLRRLQTRT